MRITLFTKYINGGKRRWRILAVSVLAAAIAALVPGLSATAAATSRAGAVRAQAVRHVRFGAQGAERGRAGRTVAMSSVPVARHAAASRTAGAIPIGLGTGYAARKAAARTSSAAPRPGQAPHQPPRATGQANTPGATKNFQGQSNSAATCPYFGGCAPPDQGLAASKNYVVQLVNTSIAIYTPTGALFTGFPKNLQAFFGVPNPSPAGCDSRGPFLSDPRAAYDPNSNRFYVTVMQIEDGFGHGIGCTATSTIWFAVSSTSNPTGTWHVYSLGVPATNASAFSDYTQFGFDTQGLYWSFNIFDPSGSTLINNVVLGIRKAQLLSGAAFNGWQFNGLNVGGTLVDTIQPVESLAHNAGPQGEIFVNSFNMKFGGGFCANGCSGLVAWDFSNIAFSGGSNPGLTGLVIGSNGYSLPPKADDPGTCSVCLETLDTRISATPAYQHGQVYAALDTAVNNGSGANVPGILWFDINTYLNPGPAACPQCTTINGSTGMLQQGYYYYTGADDAYFPTIMPDSEGNLTMGFEYSGAGTGTDPSQAYVGRRVTLPPGTMSDLGLYAARSTTPSTQGRQGDYGASSFTGSSDDAVWSAGEYSCAATGDWCTQIWRNAWAISNN